MQLVVYIFLSFLTQALNANKKICQAFRIKIIAAHLIIGYWRSLRSNRYAESIRSEAINTLRPYRIGWTLFTGD